MSLKTLLIASIATVALAPSLSLAQAVPPVPAPVAGGLFGGITTAAPIAAAAAGIGIVGVVVVVAGDSTTTSTTDTQ